MGVVDAIDHGIKDAYEPEATNAPLAAYTVSTPVPGGPFCTDECRDAIDGTKELGEHLTGYYGSLYTDAHYGYPRICREYLRVRQLLFLEEKGGCRRGTGAGDCVGTGCRGACCGSKSRGKLSSLVFCLGSYMGERSCHLHVAFVL